ncbi:MAG: amidinotransferase [Bacteroidetes bacterium]|nr:amidinotransferase [Bacteroidota bacterium]
MVISSVEEISFDLHSLAPLPRPQRVLMTTPDYFAVEYVINPHMKGNIGTVDQPAAFDQWDRLADAYRTLGLEVHTIRGAEGLLDMVFCANQTLPFITPDLSRRGVVLSRMHAPQRMDEVTWYEQFFSSIGYDAVSLPEAIDDFEGMGDAIWHPGRYMLWGGHGFRTEPSAYQFISEVLDVPVVLLSLDDPEFYHLDTCLCVLNESDAMIYPGAFSSSGRRLLNHFFDRLIEVPEAEARNLFAANAHCPDGKHVIIQKGCSNAIEALRAFDYVPVEVETSEYLKSGGSVYCMKQMFW